VSQPGGENDPGVLPVPGSMMTLVQHSKGSITMNRRILVALFALALVSMACGANINLPATKLKTGPTQTAELLVPMPAESSSAELTLEFAAGDINLSPGANGSLASGVATFNVADFAPRLEAAGASSTLRTGALEIEGIPQYSEDLINDWDLQLSDAPMSLYFNAGAYQGDFELGGLSLEKLAISDGGSDLTGRFSEPNQVEMSSFTYSTGASSSELYGLANANFERMEFNSGAGEYTFSFDGELQHDASVSIDSGVSTVTIIVPQGVDAQVTFEGGLSSVNADGGWAKDGEVYNHPGSGPALTITVKMGLGTLNLETE
jgi:hypothetical protein